MTQNLGNLFIDAEDGLVDVNGNHTVTAVGEASASDVDFKYGTKSIRTDGIGDAVRIADHADLDFGSGAFTIDFWVNITAYSSNSEGLWTMRDNDTLSVSDEMMNMFVYQDSLRMFIKHNAQGNGNGLEIITDITRDTWFHVAVVKENTTTFKVYLDGTLAHTATVLEASTFGTEGDYFAIGRRYGLGLDIPAYFDNFRIVKGEALWTANFDTTSTDELFYTPTIVDFNPTRPDTIRGLYNKKKTALRGQAAQGYIRPTIKQFFTSEDWEAILSTFFASNQGFTNDPSQNSAAFGQAVAIDGNTAIVGCPDDLNGGSASIYIKNGDTWEFQQKINGDDTSAADFGLSVDISGDSVAIGAPLDDASGSGGAVYIFTRSGVTWTKQQRVKAPTTTINDYFGWAVALNNDDLIVGARYKTISSSSNRGEAYYFNRTGTTWTHRQVLAAPGTASGQFGSSVSMDGDAVVIGHIAHWGGRGGFDIYTKTGPNTLTKSGEYGYDFADGEPSTMTGGDLGGCSVCVKGDLMVIGAYAKTVGGVDGAGAAWIFTRSGGAWSETTLINANTEDLVEAAGFGTSVAIYDENTVLVGAPKNTVGATSMAGSIFVFKNDGGWIQDEKLDAPNPEEGAEFGYSVNISTNGIVGAWKEDTTGTDTGKVYIFNK